MKTKLVIKISCFYIALYNQLEHRITILFHINLHHYHSHLEFIGGMDVEPMGKTDST